MRMIGLLSTLFISFNVLAAEECQPYQLSSGADQASGIELVYDVSFPQGCQSNPEIQQTIFQYDTGTDAQDLMPVNRGLRCMRGKKWHNGACCTQLEDGTYKCPPKKCKPYEGPGCRRLNDSV